MTIQLGTIALQTAQESMDALRTEWESLGLKVNIQSWNLQGLIAAFEANKGKSWQSMVQTAGAYDPAGGVGVGFRFSSLSPFSGVHDPALDKLLNQAQGSTSPEHPLRLLQPGRGLHRQELLRTVLLHAGPVERRGARRQRAWDLHAAVRRSRSCRRSRGRTCTTTRRLLTGKT